MTLHPATYPILFGLAIALTSASTIGSVLERRSQSIAVSNLVARIRSWWVMVVILTAAFLLGRTALILLFAFVSFLALREFVTVAAVRRSDHGALLASFLIALPGQYYLVAIGWYGLFSIFIPVYGFLILPIVAALSADTKNFLARTSETQWGLMTCVYCISYVPALMMLDIPGYSESHSGRPALLMVFLITIAQSSDVLQYIWGKLLGRHKIAPDLSPSKTVEGFAGGVASAVLLAVLLTPLTPFSRTQAAGFGLLIALMGFLGGLVMSAMKRDLGVKDWGETIPGHGGILDRLDSLCFSAPVFFHLTRYFFT